MTDNTEKLKSVVDYVEMPLSGPIYDDLNGKLYLEVRQFDGRKERTLVVRTMIDGHPTTTMVRWDVFTDALDGMRARMMGDDWDDALASLIGGQDLA